MTMGTSSVLAFWRGLSGRQGGQATTEYMLVLAVLVLALVFVFWLIAPGLRDGFVGLAQRIIAEKP